MSKEERISRNIEKKKVKDDNKKAKIEQKIIKKIEKQKIKNESIEKRLGSFKYTTDLLPFVNIEEDYFKTDNGYLNIFELEGKDNHSRTNEEVMNDIFLFQSFLKSYIDDIKFINMNFPVNTKKQQRYIEYKLERCNDEVYRKFLENKKLELVALEEYRADREYFIVLFSKDKEKLNDNIEILYRNLRGTKNINTVSLEKKINILFKLNNMNSKI